MEDISKIPPLPLPECMFHTCAGTNAIMPTYIRVYMHIQIKKNEREHVDKGMEFKFNF